MSGMKWLFRKAARHAAFLSILCLCFLSPRISSEPSAGQQIDWAKGDSPPGWKYLGMSPSPSGIFKLSSLSSLCELLHQDGVPELNNHPKNAEFRKLISETGMSAGPKFDQATDAQNSLRVQTGILRFSDESAAGQFMALLDFAFNESAVRHESKTAQLVATMQANLERDQKGVEKALKEGSWGAFGPCGQGCGDYEDVHEWLTLESRLEPIGLGDEEKVVAKYQISHLISRKTQCLGPNGKPLSVSAAGEIPRLGRGYAFLRRGKTILLLDLIPNGQLFFPRFIREKCRNIVLPPAQSVSVTSFRDILAYIFSQYFGTFAPAGECRCEDWRINGAEASAVNPCLGDEIRISADIENPCKTGMTCVVELHVRGQKPGAIQKENVFIGGEGKKRVDFDVCLNPGYLAPGAVFPADLVFVVRAGSAERSVKVSVQDEPRTEIRGTVLEAGILDAVAGARVIARPKRILDPAGIPVAAGATFFGTVRSDGHYAVSIDWGGIFAPQPGSGARSCDIRQAEFEVTVDERPRFLGPSYGVMDCGKNVLVRRRQNTEQVDFRLVLNVPENPDVLYTYTMRKDGQISESGGPLDRLILPAGRYRVSVTGGAKQTIVRLFYVLSGNPDQRLSVVASLTLSCKAEDGFFDVPPAQTVRNFRVQIETTWLPCSGPGPVESVGFVIRRGT